MTTFDPKDRELCPDGACIGVIGSDGRCKECGKRGSRRKAKRPPRERPAAAPADDVEAKQIIGEGEDPAHEASEFEHDEAREELEDEEELEDGEGEDEFDDGAAPDDFEEEDGDEFDDEEDGDEDDDEDDEDDEDDDELEAEDEDGDARAGSAGFTTAGRELCPDDMCVGLIGPDGLCKECGKPGPATSLNPRTRGLRTEEDVAEELEANIATSDIAEAPESFEERALCPDGACVGLIGSDGCCTECGARAASDD